MGSRTTTIRGLAALAVLFLAAVVPATARASELIDRDATNVKLSVNAQGQALLTYNAGGKAKRVLAWGAVNAIHPTQSQPQVKFRLDYSGGWGTYRRNVWQTFKNGCRPYDGPPLQWLVTACKAPDGSYWAVQSWQRLLADWGKPSNAQQRSWELRLSHWTGPLAVLEVNLNWAYRRYDHMYGRFTYLGRPVHGFRSTAVGNPLDTFGRNLYVDTFDSDYGPGWRRKTAFLMHKGSGAFCFGFFEQANRPTGRGTRYRATIIGPGVTPDVHWQGDALGRYDAVRDAIANEAIRELGSASCKPN